MEFFRKLERKYQRYAVPNLMYYITILYAVGLVIWLVNPILYFEYLSLDVGEILQGQVWRIVTFLLFPPAFGNWQFSTVFLGVLALFVYNNLGQTLENVWGSFRFNVFFLMGVVAQVLAAFVGYFIFKENWMLTTGFLNSSVFLAFAICFPDAQFLLFFVLPIKARWLAVAEGAVYLFDFINGGMNTKVELAVSLLNILVFFAMTRNYKRYAPKEIKRKQEFKREMKIIAPGQARHRCAVCGRTELDGENLEFRYCSKCEGNYEYCQDHLYTPLAVVAETVTVQAAGPQTVKVKLDKKTGKRYGYDENNQKVTQQWGVTAKGFRYYFGKNGAAYQADQDMVGKYGILMKKINGKYYGFDVSGHTVKGIRVGSVSMYEIPKLYYFNPKTGAVDKKKTSLYRKYAATSTLAKQNNASKIKKVLGKYKKCTISKGNTCMLDGNGKDVTYTYDYVQLNVVRPTGKGSSAEVVASITVRR